jgi:hypothetical protein
VNNVGVLCNEEKYVWQTLLAPQRMRKNSAYKRSRKLDRVIASWIIDESASAQSDVIFERIGRPA